MMDHLLHIGFQGDLGCRLKHNRLNLEEAHKGFSARIMK
jgi:hypothetical protein